MMSDLVLVVLSGGTPMFYIAGVELFTENLHDAKKYQSLDAILADVQRYGMRFGLGPLRQWEVYSALCSTWTLGAKVSP